jgi:large conductance mechanosensitive channel
MEFPNLPDRLARLEPPRVLGEFRAFLTRSNALALAVGFIVGAATGKVVSAIVDDVFMPLIGLVLPSGEWRKARLVLERGGVDADGKPLENAILYGDLIGKVIDFVVIAFVIFLLTKWILKRSPFSTRPCPECFEQVPLGAKRCRACTSPLPVP